MVRRNGCVRQDRVNLMKLLQAYHEPRLVWAPFSHRSKVDGMANDHSSHCSVGGDCQLHMQFNFSACPGVRIVGRKQG